LHPGRKNEVKYARKGIEEKQKSHTACKERGEIILQEHWSIVAN